MDKKINVENFNDYFNDRNKIRHVEKYATNLPLKEIIEQDPNSIFMGKTEISIPDNVLNKEISNNVEINAISNKTNNIYYLDSNIKKYYQIGERIDTSNLKLKENEILELELKYDTCEYLKSHFVVIEYSKEKGLLARKYTNISQVKILPQHQTKYLKIYLVSENKGFVFNVQLKLEKVMMNIVNNTFLDLNDELIYSPDSRVLLQTQNDNVLISVPELGKKFIYFSYAIQNNSFNKIPEESLIKINSNNLYKVSLPFEQYDETDFTPTIIEYNDFSKTNLIKFTNDSQFIRFQKDTNRIRLSYRFSGAGQVLILPINIIEYETETPFEEVEWSSRYEIDTHMKTIYSPNDLRIAVIMDEFTFHSYKYEAELLKLSFDNWKNEITSFMPHFVFIESSWHGNDGDWTKKVAYVTDEKHKHIKNLITFSQELDIPVVFWNKEDPVHFEHFIDTAKLCDYIFTTDRDRVEDYKEVCNHENVDVLQFAAQPIKHNPTKIQKERIDGISFAGSYYALREERSRDMDRLFNVSIPHNLFIYDRNYEYTKKGERLNFLFPNDFREYIVGTLPFYEIDKAYKGYKFMININTVKTSPTMYARRVYEGLASGTPIISNYSLGMKQQFGDIIGYSENIKALESYLFKLNNDSFEYNKVKQLGIRRVLKNHTYKKRLFQIAGKVGYQFDETISKVTFISFVNDMSEVNEAIDVFNGVSYLNKYLYVIVNDQINDHSLLNQQVSVVSKERILESFETIDSFIESDYIAPININDFYGKEFVSDMILATKYTAAEIIGKKNYYEVINGRVEEINNTCEHEYTDSIHVDSCIIKMNTFSKLNLAKSLTFLKGEEDFSNLQYLGIKIYSNDKMNYLKNGINASKELKYKVTV